jgi:tetratricopeptide (TPR) repeat protein
MQKRFIASVLFISLLMSISVPAVLAEDSADWYVKAQNTATVGNYALAVQYYNNAISLDNNYAAAYAGKAKVLNQLGRYDEALAAADKALLIKTDPDALNARAYALFSLTRDNDAVAAYDVFFTVQKNVPDAFCTQGRAYIRLNQTEKAIAAFDRCVMLAPKSLEGWNLKGLALLSLGRYTEALDAFNHCTQITTTNAEVWNNKGLAYAGIEDYPKALDSFKMAINLDPAYDEAKANLEKAYLRKPFFTPAATQKPVITLTTAAPQRTPVTTLPPAIVTTAATPSTPVPSGTPEEMPQAVKTTYASLSPLSVIISLISGILMIVLVQKTKRH